MPNSSSLHGSKICEGTVSHGTLRTQDLLRSFADQLESLLPFNGRRLVQEARDAADAIDANPDAQVANMTGSDILSDLIDELDTIAGRDGFYFGTTEGYGSDFGFWKIETEE